MTAGSSLDRRLSPWRAVVLAALVVLPQACSHAEVPAKSSTGRAVTWPEVKARLAVLRRGISRAEVSALFGEPYEEFDTTATDEHVLYFQVPDAPDMMYWIMVDTLTGRVLYTADERFPK